MSYDTNRDNVSLSLIGVRAPNTKSSRRAECHPDQKHFARSLCRSCYWKQHREKNRERYTLYGRRWAQKHPDKVKALKARFRAKPEKRAAERFYNETYRKALRYGITYEQYQQVVRFQEDKCAICGESADLRIDHNHSTGRFRGLLCNRCNSGLAFLEFIKENQLLNFSLIYIEHSYGI